MRQTDRCGSTVSKQDRKGTAGQETSSPVVKIYVRLGTDGADERVVSFRIPEGLAPLELLDEGFAIDGNQAVFTVGQVAYDRTEGAMYSSLISGGGFRTLTDALTDAQRELVTYLREKGFTPQFA